MISTNVYRVLFILCVLGMFGSAYCGQLNTEIINAAAAIGCLVVTEIRDNK